MDFKSEGIACFELASRIFPIFRSITGVGVRKTLSVLQEGLPELRVYSIASGTPVFDWTVPPEWNCEECYIENDKGEHLIDFKQHNLHVMGYSLPIDNWFSFEELKNLVYTQKGQPNAIPYVTSYYKERIGFCMSEEQLNSLEKLEAKAESPVRFHAVIKSSFNQKGCLNYGECVLKGKTEQEILISTYICHPSMANNECSGPALAVSLAKYVKAKPRKYTYRFIFIPETIGSICYIAQHLTELKKNVVAGFVLSCVGDNNDYSLIRSRYGNTLADRVLENVLRFIAPKFKDFSFIYRGSDERQFNAPGVDLPVCGFCRTKYGNYPEYHTSLDNLNYISAASTKLWFT